MPRMKRVGNPLGAAIVGLIIAGMGLYMYLQGEEGTPRFFGGILIALGVLGAVFNFALWLHYQREDRQRAERRKR